MERHNACDLCAYVRICTYIYICYTYAHIYLSISISLSVYLCVCLSVDPSTYLSIYTDILVRLSLLSLA